MSTSQAPSTPAASLDGVERLLTIGVFARRSRLSPKALRLYDERGVLTPARVDEGSGYRRYAETQLETARLVALLRRLEMPLAEVAAVVAAPEGRRAELVAQHWATVEDRFAHQRQLAEHLRIRLAGDEGGYDMYEILERDVPEQRFLTEQRHVLVQDLPGWLATSIGRLIESADSFGGQAGPTTVIYHGEVNEDSDGPVEACVPIAPDQEVTGSVPSRVEPAHARPTRGSPRHRSSSRRSSLHTRPSTVGSGPKGRRSPVPRGRSTSPTGMRPDRTTRSATSPFRWPERSYPSPSGANRSTGTPSGSRSCA
jgi:DNA-binding transcriptional MerR regulator